MEKADDTEIELDNLAEKVKPLTTENPIWPGQQVKDPDLEKNIEDLKKEYSELKKAALTNAGKAIIADRIAKGVPVITKGTLTALVLPSYSPHPQAQ